jgi:hypothetical protein
MMANANHSFAQTNIQLFNQMRELGYTAADLAAHRSGVLYCGADKRKAIEYAGAPGEAMMCIARALAAPALAEHLHLAFAAVAAAPVVQASAHNHSYVVPPRSYRRMMELVAERLDRRAAVPASSDSSRA